MKSIIAHMSQKSETIQMSSRVEKMNCRIYQIMTYHIAIKMHKVQLYNESHKHNFKIGSMSQDTTQRMS